MRPRLCICFAATPVLLLNLTQNPARSVNRVTILVDAFGKPSALKMDWGFSAFVEYEGKRVLFDTGNNAEIFAHNVKALGIDLTRLDFVVISHRHGDHTSGLHHLLKINPGVKIGSNVVIGSGSVVVKYIPDGVIAVGNPAKVIREITSSDREKWVALAEQYRQETQLERTEK